MKKRPNTVETLSKNLSTLLAETGMTRQELSKKSGVSLRMVGYILTQERKASIDVAEDIAHAFGLTGWQIIMPGLKSRLARSGGLDRLIGNYNQTTDTGREYIDRVAEHEAKYGTDK